MEELTREQRLKRLRANLNQMINYHLRMSFTALPKGSKYIPYAAVVEETRKQHKRALLRLQEIYNKTSEVNLDGTEDSKV